MPSINRIRVNNVKYNFGTQYYDDFTMRMYGKNTLYDLANGGGKSVLMLLLMQNMIPNSTLDEKQPIEKLFRTGNGNTTIHSLIEWKLDEPDVVEGYRYMTTGFCARKAESQESFEKTRDVASVEYFNYCIFYRDFNKNDIINLPLTKNGEHVGYQTLRNYLKDLPHKDMSLRVEIFDRKGEYQRFISEYGIHESQWEIIRGINKTEGHVRTYFENNYKTTRKVVEDLLIEEIIEKAYNVKTETVDGADTMAKTLLEIKEQLAELSRKKKDISAYDHQIELVDMLRERVNSFLTLYREHGELTGTLADICLTGERYARQDEHELERLANERDEKNRLYETAQYDLACLMVARDKQQLSVLNAEAERLQKEHREAELAAQKMQREMAKRESANDYLDYAEEKKNYEAQEAVIKNMLSGASFDEEQLSLYAANMKRFMDAETEALFAKEAELSDSLKKATEEAEYRRKLENETRMAIAACESAKEVAGKNAESLGKQLGELRMGMNNLSLVAEDDELAKAEKCLQEEKEKIEGLKESLLSLTKTARDLRALYDAGETECKNLSEKAEEKKRESEKLSAAAERLNGLLTVYGAKDAQTLAGMIDAKITETVLALAEDERHLKKLKKSLDRVESGRLMEPSDAVRRVMDYIETRHGAQPIYGADYISALPAEQREEVLNANPELPVGIVCNALDTLSEDPGLMFMAGLNAAVVLYDKEKLTERGLYAGEYSAVIHAEPAYFVEPEFAEQRKTELAQSIRELEEQIKSRREILTTCREDYAFALPLADGSIEKTREAVLNLSRELTKKQDENDKVKTKLREAEQKLQETESALTDSEARLAGLTADYGTLDLIHRISELLLVQEETAAKKGRELKRLRAELEGLTQAADEGSVDVYDVRQSLADIEKKREALHREWENYAAYYNPDGTYEALNLSKEELAARFASMMLAGRDVAGAIEDKRALMQSIAGSMERILKNIEKRGVDLAELKNLYETGELTFSDAPVMRQLSGNYEEASARTVQAANRLAEKRSEADRLAGSISYQTAQVEKQYGSYTEKELSMAELAGTLAEGEALVKRLKTEAREAAQAYAEYSRTRGFMVDLYKDALRIVKAHNIDLSSAVPLEEDKDRLRDLFEERLLAFDRNHKLLERAKNELLKAKGNTAQTLDQMCVFELANSIREDLVIPETYEDAKALHENLESMVRFIRLEKERVEKSLTDMKTIKENFEEQCLQRCLDVKTELEKLPRLSRIVLDGETIQMVGLTIPYVKEEFLRQRMSEYIDGLVEHIDNLSEEKDRIKYIKNALTIKKMFGVIVTDMNAIKLSLYKRERIKEQSRYLKYEEAVGSTGQSQGIYIQFLISVINYISGMYSAGEEEGRTKTIFIDNPFGAAKDIYIWEPIFALLAANHVQLIVPARGATPAITGRFDVNYILGQQMSGGKQLTVVTDFTSTVDQTDLEYRELAYEQVSFDFI